MRERAGRTTGLKGVILCLLSGSESNGPGAGGMVQRMMLEPILVHDLVYNQNNGMRLRKLVLFRKDGKRRQGQRWI